VRWHPPEPCWARRCEGDPAIFSSWSWAFCLRMYLLSDAEHHVLVLQPPGSRRATWPNRDKRRWRKISPMVDKPDRWSTSALEIWAHQHNISSICRWHLMWKASSVLMSATKRVYVSVPYSRTDLICAWYTRALILTNSFKLHTKTRL